MISLCTPGAVGHILLACQAVCNNIRLMMLVLGFTVGACILIAKAGWVAGDACATNPCIKVLDPEIQRIFPGQTYSRSLCFSGREKAYFVGPQLRKSFGSFCLISLDFGDFPRGSDGKESTCNAGDPGLTPGLRRSPGEGNDNPLQYSCLANPMNRGAWRSMELQSRTQPSDWHFTVLLLSPFVVIYYRFNRK